jgi:Flp pilus assembly protein protease CpaA
MERTERFCQHIGSYNSPTRNNYIALKLGRKEITMKKPFRPKKNKIISLFLSVIMLLSMLTATSLTASATESGIEPLNIPNTWNDGTLYYSIHSNDTATVSGLVNTSFNGSVVIPSTLNMGSRAITVVGIREWAFSSSKITSVTIPNTVTAIGVLSFACSSITSITIPNSVITIGSEAFFGCSQLTSVTFQAMSKVETIGLGAFQDAAITSITIPNSVITIEGYAFLNCSQLASLTFQSTSKVTTIGSLAFTNTAITSLTVPNSVTAIGNLAFAAEPLSSVTFQATSKLTSIGGSAFASTAITSITIPDSVTARGNWAFAGCANLRSVSFGTNVNNIGTKAFSDCAVLTTLHFRTGARPTVANDAFSGVNTNLITMLIPLGSRASYSVLTQSGASLTGALIHEI